MHLLLARRRILQGLQLLLVLACLWAGGARGQGVELASLDAHRADGVLSLDLAVRVTLPAAVQDALQRGVPIYFAADARLLRSRWYWRDERVARVSRSWRVAYQPLTDTWRVGLGGLHQTHATLNEALTAASRAAGWKLADLSQIDPDDSYYIEFSYRLDTGQLPAPIQFGLGGLGGTGEWTVGVQRVLRLDPER
ncbi:MAG TPA: DUF4390 domain-containing protein [Rubrivivax sp.]|nr:DUF4390 domain-containing protein [Rubrivivax sp.]